MPLDLTFLPRHRPELFTATWDRLIALCASGAIRPLPLRIYRLEGLREALRLMQSGRHLGKLVLDLTAPGRSITPLPRPGRRFAAEALNASCGPRSPAPGICITRPAGRPSTISCCSLRWPMSSATPAYEASCAIGTPAKPGRRSISIVTV